MTPSPTDISVFGGTGFIGSRFCALTHRKPLLIPRDSRIPQSSESVYFISTTHNYHVFDDVHVDVDTNLTLLLDVLKNVQPGKSVFNFISSWFVYGETTLPASETSECHPKGFYSITKRAAEQLLISYCETFHIDYRILRLCNVYGPGDADVGKQKNALQHIIRQLKANSPVQLYHDGHFFRDYLYVDDVSRAIDLCIDKAPLNRIINIGSGDKVEFRDIILMAKDILHSTSSITTMEPPEFHKTVQVKDFYMSVEPLKALGFKPQVSIQKGIEILCHS